MLIVLMCTVFVTIMCSNNPKVEAKMKSKKGTMPSWTVGVSVIDGFPTPQTYIGTGGVKDGFIVRIDPK